MRKLRMSELNRLSDTEFQLAEKHPFYVVLDNVRSTLNVGSVFRTADAFKCKQIVLTGVTPTPNKIMNKTALGASETVEWIHEREIATALENLKSKGVALFAVEQVENSSSLLNWQKPVNKEVAFIFGNEVTGVSDEAIALCDGCIEIPQYGTKHSLNIAVSAGVILWNFIKQHK
jgi:tRNA G18 (ribose-2'-O)-methylase SpoU